MIEENTQFIDESGDRKHFTIVPNIIVNGYTAMESGVYLYIKKRAGEGGEFYERVKIAARNLGIDPKTFRKIRDKFVRDGKLKYVGERKESASRQGGKQTIKVYKITDIWKENIKNYKGRENTPTLKLKGRENTSLKGRENTTPNNNLIKKEPIINMSAKPTDWQLEKEIEKLLKDPRRHIQVIGVWIKEKGLNPENAEQMQSLIKRNLKPARLLNGYTNEDIHETVKVIKNTEYLKKWTLETIAKYIDEVVAQKKKQGRRIIRFEEIKRSDGSVAMRPIMEILKEWKNP